MNNKNLHVHLKMLKQKNFWTWMFFTVFVYDKIDDVETKTASLNFISCSFISKELNIGLFYNIQIKRNALKQVSQILKILWVISMIEIYLLMKLL